MSTPDLETKPFHIGDVLSAATGKLISLDHIGGVYNILNWMTGDNLFTHQLPRASREAEPILRAAFSELCAVDVPSTIDSMESAKAFLESLYPRFGEYVDVPKLATDDHTEIDPIAEIKMINPNATIIGIGEES